MTQQIPDEIIDILFQSMVYKPFLNRYAHVLQYFKEDPINLYERYTWKDPEYRDYIRHLFSILEPREEQPGTLIIEELGETLEVTFLV